MGCCGGGVRKDPPAREPRASCDGEYVTFAADAWVIAQKNGLDPCTVTGTGREGLVTRYDVLRALGRA